MNYLAIRNLDDVVFNVVVADAPIVSADAGYRFVAAEGDLASAGIGWTVSADGTATPPASWLEIEEPVEEPSPSDPAAG